MKNSPGPKSEAKPPAVPKVKVCGITELEDALRIAEMGVDFLGFNFYPKTTRYIDPQSAARILEKIQGPEIVGVFVKDNPERMRALFEDLPLDLVQFHGHESTGEIEATGLPALQAVGISSPDDLPQSAPQNVRYLLYDVKDTQIYGGTGATFDWTLLPNKKHPRPFFLAGGLGPHNLKAAIETARPYAVDLNSRVELSPGKKDLKAVEACLNIVRSFASPA